MKRPGSPAQPFCFGGQSTALLIRGKPVSVLARGNAAWRNAGLPLKSGMEKAGTVVDDIFVQPFLWGQLDPTSAAFRRAADEYFRLGTPASRAT